MTSTRPSTRTVALIALLGGAMATATYMQGALSVLSRFVIDEMGITRSQLGFAFAMFSLVGGIASPMLGVLTDLGTRRVMAGLFVAGAAGMLLVAAAPSYPLLLAATAVGGLALGAGNPVTNRVVSERIPLDRRGLVIGLKQSGPPLGLLAAGAVLPVIAVTFDWRVAMVASALLPISGLIATPLLVPSESPAVMPAGTTEESGDAKAVVLWLTVIGFGVAMGLSAVLAFLPLFAQERVGMTATSAGALAAFVGLAGVVSRILWGNHARRFRRPSSALLVMSVMSLGAVAAIAVGEAWGPVPLWIGAAGVGTSMLAWHSIAWLVIIDRVGLGKVGKASGIMQLGNSFGFASGPPAAGWIIDASGSYAPGWGMVLTLFGIVTALTVWVRVRTTGRREQESRGRPA